MAYRYMKIVDPANNIGGTWSWGLSLNPIVQKTLDKVFNLPRRAGEECTMFLLNHKSDRDVWNKVAMPAIANNHWFKAELQARIMEHVIHAGR